jgi:hypothetical protein
MGLSPTLGYAHYVSQWLLAIGQKKAPSHQWHLPETTKYVYIKITTVYVPSSELGLSQPHSRQRVCPSPRTGGGGTLACR